MPITPSAGSAPKLIKQESIPIGTTLYVEIDLKVVDKFGIAAPPVTGIFIPDGYAPGAAVDLILYLHGHKAEKIRRQAIDQYWNASDSLTAHCARVSTPADATSFSWHRPWVLARKPASAEPGGLDAYLAQVRPPCAPMGRIVGLGPRRLSAISSSPAIVAAVGPCVDWPEAAIERLPVCANAGATTAPTIGAMTSSGRDGRGPVQTPGSTSTTFGSPTARLAESLRDKRVRNAIVQPARDRRHNYVPIAHWRERMQGAGFLAARPGGAVPRRAGAPADVRPRSKDQFIRLVGENARRAKRRPG